MNIKVVPTDGNKVNVYTGSGTQLVGDTAVTIQFDAKGIAQRGSRSGTSIPASAVSARSRSPLVPAEAWT